MAAFKASSSAKSVTETLQERSAAVIFSTVFSALAKKFVFPVEDGNFSCAIEGSLAGNGRSGTAGTEEDDFFTLDVNPIFVEVMDEADTVRIIADQLAVLNDDGIAGADQLAAGDNSSRY